MEPIQRPVGFLLLISLSILLQPVCLTWHLWSTVQPTRHFLYSGSYVMYEQPNRAVPASGHNTHSLVSCLLRSRPASFVSWLPTNGRRKSYQRVNSALILPRASDRAQSYSCLELRPKLRRLCIVPDTADRHIKHFIFYKTCLSSGGKGWKCS